MDEITVNGVSIYRPTYKLIAGEPGTSHAFEIAESLGLDADIVREAREFIKDEGGRIESLISELKQKATELKNKLMESEGLKQEAGHLREQLREELLRLKTTEKDMIVKALKEAEDFIRKAKKEARDIVETIKRSSLADAREAVKELDRKLEEVIIIRKQYSAEKTSQLREVREGRRVLVNALGKHGLIHSVNEKSGRCKVFVDGREIEVAFADLSEPVTDNIQGSGTVRHAPAETNMDINIPNELNVIGQRVDPALSLVERYLNDASIADLKQVKIIHGIGAGILSSAIREYLKDHPLVENFRKGSEDEGGEAVTVVVF